jgi:hypothetical protein
MNKSNNVKEESKKEAVPNWRMGNFAEATPKIE